MAKIFRFQPPFWKNGPTQSGLPLHIMVYDAPGGMFHEKIQPLYVPAVAKDMSCDSRAVLHPVLYFPGHKDDSYTYHIRCTFACRSHFNCYRYLFGNYLRSPGDGHWAPSFVACCMRSISASLITTYSVFLRCQYSFNSFLENLNSFLGPRL